jgi:hypothetical protein
MAELLRLSVSQEIAPDYARQLLAAFPKHVWSAIPIDKERTVHTQLLVEPLSEREIEVLRLMTEVQIRRDRQKTGRQHQYVRYHPQRFSKLESTTTQAIGRAKALNIRSSPTSFSTKTTSFLHFNRMNMRCFLILLLLT